MLSTIDRSEHPTDRDHHRKQERAPRMSIPSENDAREKAVPERDRALPEPRPARELLPLVYDELRRLAAQRMTREVPGLTLQATALVHEAYLRLVGKDPDRPWDGRGHFFAAAAEAMRRILVETARRRGRLKRGGGRARIDLDKADPAAPESDEQLLALDEALELLAKSDPVKAQLVQLRVFAGLTLKQAAEILGISSATADRYWAYARAWLRVEIAARDEKP
jgi:RNA polymerase sigma factor (TIGR02999 family)